MACQRPGLPTAYAKGTDRLPAEVTGLAREALVATLANRSPAVVRSGRRSSAIRTSALPTWPVGTRHRCSVTWPGTGSPTARP